MKRVISLGAGVQSTTMALMAAHGQITPMPDAAIFADTGSEPKAVYEHLAWLRSSNMLPFPVHVVGKPIPLHETLMRPMSGGLRYASIPAFLDRGPAESEGIGRRQCTKEYKLEPLIKKQREVLGFEPRKRIPPRSIEVWIGISTDEAVRMKPSKHRWIVNRYPLAMEHRMSRGDCLEWLKRHGYPEPPKSACTFCPYRSDAEWRRLKDTDEDAFAQAVAVDNMIREGNYSRKLRFRPFLHRSLKPLAEVDFSTSEERGQPDLFNNDCEGMCGL